MTEEEKKEAINIEKYFWLITEHEYGKLRTIEGCGTLSNLNATVPDGKHIMKIAENLGVPEGNRFINISPTIEDLKKNHKAIMKLSRKKSTDGIPHIIFVYVGGHGATSEEKQIYLLNDSDPKKAMFMIEFKLRYIA